VGIVAALVRLLVLHLLGDAVSISELDQLLEQRWPGKVRRGGALALAGQNAEPMSFARKERNDEVNRRSRTETRERW